MEIAIPGAVAVQHHFHRVILPDQIIFASGLALQFAISGQMAAESHIDRPVIITDHRRSRQTLLITGIQIKFIESQRIFPAWIVQLAVQHRSSRKFPDLSGKFPAQCAESPATNRNNDRQQQMFFHFTSTPSMRVMPSSSQLVL